MRDQAEPFLLEQIKKLEEERDELRAALKLFMGSGIGNSTSYDAQYAALNYARATLAKYEEKK